MAWHRSRGERAPASDVGIASDTDDIVQASFVSAWCALKHYDPTRSFAAWLRTIALDKCRDPGRQAAVGRLLMIPVAASTIDIVLDPRPGAEADLIAQEELATLDCAIVLLPRALKEPLLLTVFAGLSQAEAGRELGVSAKAIETRVYRARQALTEAIAKGDLIRRTPMRIFAVAAALLLSSPGYAQMTAATLPVEARAASAVVVAFHAALGRGDTRAAAALLANDALIYESGGVERGKAEYAAHHLAADATFAKAMKRVVTRQAGAANGRTAWIASESTTKGYFKNKPINSVSTETMILRRDRAGWRIVHVHWSSANVK